MYANAVNLNGLEGAKLLTAHSCLCLTKIIGEAVCVSPCDLSDTLRVFCALGSLLPCRAYYLATLPLSLARRTLPPPHLHAAERAIAQPGRVRVRRVGWARARADTGRLIAQLLTATARG